LYLHAPTRSEAINLRGAFALPVEQHAEQLLPSLTTSKSGVIGA
jgi:hypothetical protein